MTSYVRFVVSWPIGVLVAICIGLLWLVRRTFLFVANSWLELVGPAVWESTRIQPLVRLVNWMSWHCDDCEDERRTADDAANLAEAATKAHNEIAAMLSGWRCRCGASFFDGSTASDGQGT